MNTIDLTRLLFAGILALAFAGWAMAEMADPLDELKRCARTENRDERIACYEALGQHVLEQEVSAAPAAPEPAPAPAAQAGMPDDLGKASEAKAEKKKKKEAPLLGAGRVNRCRLSRDDLWHFYFDNGQVWRQSGDARYRFEDCDFDVTITKDFFGYKMKIDGGQTIRVRRID